MGWKDTLFVIPCAYRGLTMYSMLLKVKLVTYCVVLAWVWQTLTYFLRGQIKKKKITESGKTLDYNFHKILDYKHPMKDTIKLISLLMKMFTYVPLFLKLQVNLESSFEKISGIKQDESIWWSQPFKPNRRYKLENISCHFYSKILHKCLLSFTNLGHLTF